MAYSYVKYGCMFNDISYYVLLYKTKTSFMTDAFLERFFFYLYERVYWYQLQATMKKITFISAKTSTKKSYMAFLSKKNFF